jgi:linoleoyl-CoA desaturase
MRLLAPAPALRAPEPPETDALDALAAIRAAVQADLDGRDRAYITRVIATQRWLEVAGRALLAGARFAPAAVAGTALLAMAKGLENMEIGHNVLHGQWDWMRDVRLATPGG